MQENYNISSVGIKLVIARLHFSVFYNLFALPTGGTHITCSKTFQTHTRFKYVISGARGLWSIADAFLVNSVQVSDFNFSNYAPPTSRLLGGGYCGVCQGSKVLSMQT